MSPQPVLVTWIDAHASAGDGWVEVSELDGGPVTVESVGFLLPDAKDGHVVLVQSVASSELVADWLAIPEVSVVSIVWLSLTGRG